MPNHFPHKSPMELLSLLADEAGDMAYKDLTNREGWLYIEAVLSAAREGVNITFGGDTPIDYEARKSALTMLYATVERIKP